MGREGSVGSRGARVDEEDDVLDRAVMEIQEAILNDARKIYSEKVIDHFLHPRNVGGIGNADGFGKVTGPCGDTMYIFLRVKGEKILEARFMTDGCGSTIACGSALTELAKGKMVDEALKITELDLTNALEGLPESSIHCSVLATRTLREAIGYYRSSKEGKRAAKGYDTRALTSASKR